ncbi:MAG TPA: 3-beta hydroxysteroid dehydrogenase, partial [Oculatellaceae cyanobacterium]
AVRALEVPETVNKSFPVVGTRAWGAYEIIRLCERLSGKQSKIARLPLNLLRGVRGILRFFQWGWNVADRLAFTEVLATGKPLEAPMDEVYEVFGLDPKETTTLEAYLQEYFTRIMKKLKEIEFETNKTKKQSKKKTPFKSKS